MKLTGFLYFIFLLLVSILGTGCNGDNSTKDAEEKKVATAVAKTEETKEEKVASRKPLPSVNIKPNDKIDSPTKIEVNSKGVWFGFEGELGTVVLVNEEGEKLGLGILKTTENWMVKGPVNYQCNLAYDANKAGNGKLVFSNNNPSGEEKNDQSFEIPVSYMASSKIK